MNTKPSTRRRVLWGCALAGAGLLAASPLIDVGAQSPARPAVAANDAPLRNELRETLAARPNEITSRRLGIAAGQTAAERALELASRLESAQTERESLERTVRDLETLIARQDERLRRTTEQVEATRLRQRLAAIVAPHVDDEVQQRELIDALLAEQTGRPVARATPAAHATPSDVPAQRPAATSADNTLAMAGHRDDYFDYPPHPKLRERVRTLFQHKQPEPKSNGPATQPQGPGISSKHLGIASGTTAAERSLELSAKLEMLADEREQLAVQVRDMETEIRERDKKLVEAAREIQAARQELTDTRDQIQRWRQNVDELREKIRVAEQENLDTLQAIVSLLKQLLAAESTNLDEER